MKNVMVANLQATETPCPYGMLEAYTKAQIENSLELGWAREDILLLTNFALEFRGVRARQLMLHDGCLTASKTFAMHELFKEEHGADEYWVHDLDAWQNFWFDCPPFQDVGICRYADRYDHSFSGGSVFYRRAAKDIVAVADALLDTHATMREERALNTVLNASAFRHRVTVLNSTYNVGCDNFVERYEQSDKPIYVCHFHPDRSANAKIHLLGQNALKVKTVTGRLERLLGRYFLLP